MPPRAKVPFTLHPALRLQANTDLDSATTAALAPDGGTAAVVLGTHPQRSVELIDVATGAITTAYRAPPDVALDCVLWSPDGRRWVASGSRFIPPNSATGVVLVGERGSSEPPREVHTSAYGTLSINDLQIPAPVLSFTPDGERLVMRVSGRDERNALFHIDLATGAVREQWLDPSELDLLAQAVTHEGTVYTLHHTASDVGGLAWYTAASERPAGRHPWIFGCAIVPTARGLWVLGTRATYAFRLADLSPAPIARAAAERRARIDELRARARSKWDKQWLDYQLTRESDGSRTNNGFSPSRGRWREAKHPEPTAGARIFETELFWETATVARLGDDDLLVADGLAVWHWHFDGSALRRTMVLDDPQRATRPYGRLRTVSTAGDTVLLLWQRDNNRQKTVLSRFTIDRARLPG